MVTLNRPSDLQEWIGKKIGSSDWLLIDQLRIDDFARITCDPNWIHVDVERARRDMPDGKTIAHGLLTLSLVPFLAGQTYSIAQFGRLVNYGSNRLRFTAPVQAGDRIRLHQIIKATDPVEKGMRVTSECTVEIEGKARPALVVELLMIVYDA